MWGLFEVRENKSLEQYFVDGYLPTIGIECHVQLKTETKLFTAIAMGDFRQSKPNENVGPLCLGLPGALPVVNQKAIDLAITAGLALGCQIASETSFDRKHYFYPDLPLGYQISQHYQPLVLAGSLEIPLSFQQSFEVRLDHAHLEADAGKLSHPPGVDHSLLDANRVGAPLLEIVSQPDMHSAEEAKQYAKELYLRMVYAEVCEGDLSAGNLRFDVNVSVSRDQSLGTRTEIKNLNSFRFVQQAVNYEIKRQIQALQAGQKILQETRGWNEENRTTFSQRSKEDSQDYRYMPDPDIPPLAIKPQYVQKLQAEMGVSPPVLRQLFKQWQLPFSTAEILLDEPALGRLLYEEKDQLEAALATLIANWLVGDLLAALHQAEIKASDIKIAWSQLKDLAKLVLNEKISATVAKKWLLPVVAEKNEVQSLLKEAGGGQISDPASLQALIDQVFSQQPKAVADAVNDLKAVGFLVGQVMQLSRGRANPKLVNELIQAKLKIMKE